MHCVSAAAEDLLDKELPVLDKGFLRLVDYLGSDARIVQAARVSYGPGTRTVRDDEKLIRYLWANRHTSPFEQVVFTFHLKLPIFVMRQLVRHRTARLNEISARYSEMKDEFYIPELERIKGQDNKNKQGSAGDLLDSAKRDTRDDIAWVSKEAYDYYKMLLMRGVSRELARLVLPVNLYTECYWQIDLNNLFKFMTLRSDTHAQMEIRQYTYPMETCVKAVCPLAHAAYVEESPEE